MKVPKLAEIIGILKRLIYFILTRNLIRRKLIGTVYYRSIGKYLNSLKADRKISIAYVRA